MTNTNLLTPENLITIPHRSAAIPNESGTAALYTVSTYSFDAHAKTSEIRLFDVLSKQSKLITNEAKTSEPNWLGNEILFLRGGENGTTEIVVTSVEEDTKSQTVAVVPGPISDVKLKILGPDKAAFMCSGKSTPEGSLYNPQTAQKKNHSGMLYDSLMVRHWDHPIDENRHALWYAQLTKSQPHITEKQGRWSLSPLINALEGTNLESPVEPFPSGDHFDLSIHGIAFISKAPDLDPAYNTRTDLYFLPLADLTKPPNAKPKKIELDGLEGASTSPSFSSDGQSLVYLSMKINGHESDKNRIILVQDIHSASPPKGIELHKNDSSAGRWLRSPSKAIFTNNDTHLLLLAEKQGTVPLWTLNISSLSSIRLPTRLTSSGCISSLHPTSPHSVFLCSSSFVDPCTWTILDPASPDTPTTLYSAAHADLPFALSPDQVSSITFPGARNRAVHAWIIRPGASVRKPPIGLKWPLAMLVHGGPEAAWLDRWNSRWNPAVFASQGYVVVLPNPTGSTGFGQAFTDAIRGEWGGAPYEDLVACFEYVEREMGGEVDVNRAVALGASYGGYMMNWMQGKPLGRRFRALVCHHGVFSLAGMLGSDEQYFPAWAFRGTYFSEARKEFDRWDPLRYAEGWKTPMLVIHSDKDYRIPISDGLAAFAVLQGKGIESRFLTFPDENHWVLDEENSLVWHAVTLNWINSFVGLPPYMDEDKIFASSGSRWRKPKAAGPR